MRGKRALGGLLRDKRKSGLLFFPHARPSPLDAPLPDRFELAPRTSENTRDEYSREYAYEVIR